MNGGQMNIVVSPRLASYGLLACLGLFGGLAAHRPALVLLGVPFALALVVGLRAVRRPEIWVGASLSAERVLEGDQLELRWEVQASAPVGQVELVAALPPGLRQRPGQPAVASLEVDRPGVFRATQVLEAVRWGQWPIHRLAWQVLDPGRLVVHETLLDCGLVARVHPTPEHLREIIEPAHTAVGTGAHTSREMGEGIEFADVRPYSPGDHLRGVNWRATARHGGELWVNRQHLERNADVVLLIDTLSEAALEPAVRAALRLANAYAERRDRIGIVSFGGSLRWVEPGTGMRHLYRILDALLLTHTGFSYTWADPVRVPQRVLTPRGLVFALSPLDDTRSFDTLRYLRSRGSDLVVIEIDGRGVGTPGRSAADQLAHRLWELHREAQRTELAALGVPVVRWRDDIPLAATLAEVAAFRRGQVRRGRGVGVAG